MTRRANSYHSYSQSPPYDYQYEERRYGKIPLGLTGKSASVKGLHSKASSFVYSPGRFSDHTLEDQFANERSAPRASDFSASSGGETFRSEIQSPNFQQEGGFRSPQSQHSNAPPSENLFPAKQHQVKFNPPPLKGFFCIWLLNLSFQFPHSENYVSWECQIS